METIENETWFAAVDNGVADGIQGTGAVYGIGHTYDEAVADARSECGESDASYDVVRCTSEAAAYIREHGGAPSARIDVDRNGVELYNPEES